MRFCENGNFSQKNGQNFARCGKNLHFFDFYIIIFMVTAISVISSIIGTVLVKLWPKKYKKPAHFGPQIKFPNKSKKLANISGPYLGNRPLFCNAVYGAETAMENTFI